MVTVTKVTRRDESIYSCGNVEVDVYERTVRVAGLRVPTTYGEFEILLRLIRGPWRVFTRLELRPPATSDKSVSPRSIDVHILRLRQKIAQARDFIIETVHNVGYRCRAISPDGVNEGGDGH